MINISDNNYHMLPSAYKPHPVPSAMIPIQTFEDSKYVAN